MTSPAEVGAGPTMSRRLELRDVELVGGGRTIPFHPGLNIVQGDISTGKTTLVRLLRGLLATMPDNLPPEVQYVSAIRARVLLANQAWRLYRPRATTANALVEAVEDRPDGIREPLALRLPVAGREGTYSQFMLGQLSIPAVSVPTARTRPTESLSPVTMSDWLGYCIITGDELDTQVFGHRHPHRDIKRRWVFELAYGYYDPEVAQLTAALRSVELQIRALETEAAFRDQFLANTPFQDPDAIEAQIVSLRSSLDELERDRQRLGSDAQLIGGAEVTRRRLLEARATRAELSAQASRLDTQIEDLTDLRDQLVSQAARLTRAIVADEWLVDFDFVVCPRCGNDVDTGRSVNRCYLCLQEPRPAPTQAHLLAEQGRIADQISETDDVIHVRMREVEHIRAELAELETRIDQLAADVDRMTAGFVSDHSEQLEHYAAMRAHIEGNIDKLTEYYSLHSRHQNELKRRAGLEAQRDEIMMAINSRELSTGDAESNVKALEGRILAYLRELHIPQFGDELSVELNRTTYMPVIAGRPFDQLSSQGLKTLVNVAHSLAHHTVAIDRNLPMPGLLVLDGLSANAGHEGFDQERVEDIYRLLQDVSADYEGRLQIIAVDNPLPRKLILGLRDSFVLTLTQEDRLIRIPQEAPPIGD